MQDPTHEQKLKTVCDYLRREIKVDAIYCIAFGSREHCSGNVLFPDMEQTSAQQHYTLLVLAESFPQQFVADASETIRQQSSGNITVTLLAYKTVALAQPGEHQYLLYHAMTKCMRLYRRKSKRLLLRFNEIPVRDAQQTEREWNSRKYNAICFLEAETAIENPNSNTVQVVLLHTALEQLCMGLVYVFLGHRVDSFGIGYLLRLCDVFTPLAASIFPDYSDEDKRLLKVLSSNNSTLRYQPQVKTSITDVETLRKRVRQFFEQAVALVESELERMKQLNETTNLNT